MSSPARLSVAFVISSMQAGGAERVCATLANHWATTGWDITLITFESSPVDFYPLNSSIRRIALYEPNTSGGLPARVLNNLKLVSKLRKALASVDPDVAFSLVDRNNVLLAAASLGSRRYRAIGSEHVHPPQAPPGPYWSALRRLTYPTLWAVSALTPKSAEWISRHTRANRVPVIPNPVSWPIERSEPEVAPPPKRGRRILAAGRLRPQKGFDLLLPCFAEVTSPDDGWELAILGDGEERARLEAQIRALNLGDRVIIPGTVGNISDWYGTADLFVMPSRFEGFPMTLVEAMASGVAPISFDCDTGPGEIIRHGVDGLLVPAGDLVRLKSELQRLMSDDAERVRLADRAREVRERFAVEKIATRWEVLFRDALSTG